MKPVIMRAKKKGRKDNLLGSPTLAERIALLQRSARHHKGEINTGGTPLILPDVSSCSSSSDGEYDRVNSDQFRDESEDGNISTAPQHDSDRSETAFGAPWFSEVSSGKRDSDLSQGIPSPDSAKQNGNQCKVQAASKEPSDDAENDFSVASVNRRLDEILDKLSRLSHPENATDEERDEVDLIRNMASLSFERVVSAGGAGRLPESSKQHIDRVVHAILSTDPDANPTNQSMVSTNASGFSFERGPDVFSTPIPSMYDRNDVPRHDFDVLTLNDLKSRNGATTNSFNQPKTDKSDDVNEREDDESVRFGSSVESVSNDVPGFRGLADGPRKTLDPSYPYYGQQGTGRLGISERVDVFQTQSANQQRRTLDDTISFSSLVDTENGVGGTPRAANGAAAWRSSFRIEKNNKSNSQTHTSGFQASLPSTSLGDSRGRVRQGDMLADSSQSIWLPDTSTSNGNYSVPCCGEVANSRSQRFDPFWPESVISNSMEDRRVTSAIEVDACESSLTGVSQEFRDGWERAPDPHRRLSSQSTVSIFEDFFHYPALFPNGAVDSHFVESQPLSQPQHRGELSDTTMREANASEAGRMFSQFGPIGDSTLLPIPSKCQKVHKDHYDDHDQSGTKFDANACAFRQTTSLPPSVAGDISRRVPSTLYRTSEMRKSSGASMREVRDVFIVKDPWSPADCSASQPFHGDARWSYGEAYVKASREDEGRCNRILPRDSVGVGIFGVQDPSIEPIVSLPSAPDFAVSHEQEKILHNTFHAPTLYGSAELPNTWLRPESRTLNERDNNPETRSVVSSTVCDQSLKLEPFGGGGCDTQQFAFDVPEEAEILFEKGRVRLPSLRKGSTSANCKRRSVDEATLEKTRLCDHGKDTKPLGTSVLGATLVWHPLKSPMGMFSQDSLPEIGRFSTSIRYSNMTGTPELVRGTKGKHHVHSEVVDFTSVPYLSVADRQKTAEVEWLLDNVEENPASCHRQTDSNRTESDSHSQDSTPVPFDEFLVLRSTEPTINTSRSTHSDKSSIVSQPYQLSTVWMNRITPRAQALDPPFDLQPATAIKIRQQAVRSRTLRDPPNEMSRSFHARKPKKEPEGRGLERQSSRLMSNMVCTSCSSSTGVVGEETDFGDSRDEDSDLFENIDDDAAENSLQFVDEIIGPPLDATPTAAATEAVIRRYRASTPQPLLPRCASSQAILKPQSAVATEIGTVTSSVFAVHEGKRSTTQGKLISKGKAERVPDVIKADSLEDSKTTFTSSAYANPAAVTHAQASDHGERFDKEKSDQVRSYWRGMTKTKPLGSFDSGANENERDSLNVDESLSVASPKRNSTTFISRDKRRESQQGNTIEVVNQIQAPPPPPPPPMDRRQHLRVKDRLLHMGPLLSPSSDTLDTLTADSDRESTAPADERARGCSFFSCGDGEWLNGWQLLGYR